MTCRCRARTCRVLGFGAAKQTEAHLERHVRATTAFNKMLAVPGAHVVAVRFTPSAIVVDLRRRARRLECPCGWSTRAVYDRRERHWRGLDLGAARLVLRGEIRRLSCRRCGR